MRLDKRLRRAFAGVFSRHNPNSFFAQSEAFGNAYILVRIFYAIQFFFVSNFFSHWVDWRQTTTLEPLWPVAWIPWFHTAYGVDVIICLFALGVVLAASHPHVRLYRFLAFLGFFLCVAFNNSFGKIGHASHGWIFASFIFIFLPDGKRITFEQNRVKRQKYLLCFLTAQAMILMTYSLAGCWKVIAAVQQFLLGKLSAFSIDGFGHQIAERLLQTGSVSRFGPFLIENPSLGWLLLWVAIYIEVFALVAVFRPALHRLWGLSLIGLHLGAGLILTVTFSKAILLIGLILLCSPFHPQNFTVKRMLIELPIIHMFASRRLKIN